MKELSVSALFIMTFLLSGCARGGDDSSARVLGSDEKGLRSQETAGGDQSAVMLEQSGTLEGAGFVYVDCQRGNDSNSGTTSSDPLKTIAKARSSLLNSNGLLLRRGASCHEPLKLDLSFSTNTGEFAIGVFGPGTDVAYMFGKPFQTLNWSPAKDIAINGKPVPYLKNTPIHSATLSYRAAQILDAGLIPQTQSRHPNNDWEFLGGTTAVAEGDGWFALTVPIYAFAEFGATRNETVTYRINNWYAQAFPVWDYTKERNLLELSRAVDPTYRGTARANWGYRYQNSLAALDTPGEWYQDYGANGKIYYWPPNNSVLSGRFLIPEAVDVISLNGGNRPVVIRDVSIIGAGSNGILVKQLPSVKVERVQIWASNENGISIWRVPNTEIRSSKIGRSNANGIEVNDVSNLLIAGNTIEGSGRFATQPTIGMALSGIRYAVVSTSSRVEKNKIKASGFAGISAANLAGSSVIRMNEVVDSCLYLNDCGAIYLNGQGMKSAVSVSENKITNSIGNQSGGGGEGDLATGVYLDWVLSNSTIFKNVIVNADNKSLGSIFVHGGSNNRISDNTIAVSSPNFSGVVARTELKTGSVPRNNLFERNVCTFPAGTNGNCLLNVK